MTSSLPYPTTRTIRVQPAPKQARRMYSSIGRPQISCSGLGFRDFIRVLFPAARMTAVNDIERALLPLPPGEGRGEGVCEYEFAQMEFRVHSPADDRPA